MHGNGKDVLRDQEIDSETIDKRIKTGFKTVAQTVDLFGYLGAAARGAENMVVDPAVVRMLEESFREVKPRAAFFSSIPANQKQACPLAVNTSAHLLASSETPSVPAKRVEIKPMFLAIDRPLRPDCRMKAPNRVAD
jgi:hypothetical protein